MNIGAIVKYRQTLKDHVTLHLTGVIVKIHGAKWVTIAWSDGVSMREHLADLVVSFDADT